MTTKPVWIAPEWHRHLACVGRDGKLEACSTLQIPADSVAIGQSDCAHGYRCHIRRKKAQEARRMTKPRRQELDSVRALSRITCPNSKFQGLAQVPLPPNSKAWPRFPCRFPWPRFPCVPVLDTAMLQRVGAVSRTTCPNAKFQGLAPAGPTGWRSGIFTAKLAPPQFLDLTNQRTQFLGYLSV